MTMKKTITLLDGATGTSLWALSDNKNPVWTYNLDNPGLVKKLFKDFADVGAEIISANTFGANRPAVEASSDMPVLEVVKAAVRLARQAREEKIQEDSRFSGLKIALDFGPMSSLLEPWGDLTYDDCRAAYAEILAAGMSEGPDMIFLMTFMDLDMLRIAAEEALKYDVPVFATMSFTEHGRTIMGNSPEDMIEALEPLGISALGVNCSLGPDKALPILKDFAAHTDLPLIFKPNAGIPILSEGGGSAVPCTPESFADAFVPALEYASYVGGCCGTDPVYLKAIKNRIDAQI